MSLATASWDYEALDPILVQVQLRALSTEEHRAHLQQQTITIKESVRAGKKYFLVIDARVGVAPPADMRKAQADWLKENAEALASTCLGIGFVIEDRLVRGGMTAVFWLTKSPVPYTVHATLDQAIAHAVEVCRKAGLEIPPAATDNPTAKIEAELDKHLGSAA